MQIETRRTHGKFSHVQKAEINGTSFVQAGQCRRRDIWDEVFRDDGTIIGFSISSIKQLLVRHGYAVQQPQ
jgi:hypothetical protein